MGMSRKEITYGAPAKTQRSGFRGERKKEWSGWSPRRQAGTEQSGISSDESQEALKRFYPQSEKAQDPQFFKKAYKDIQRFMDANGFERRQYSVYVSAEKLTTLDVALLTQRMADQLPWLRLCVKEITATNIGARHSLGVPRRKPAKRLRWGEEEGMERAESSPSGGDGAERNFFRRAALRRRPR